MVIIAKMLFTEGIDFDELSGRGSRRVLREAYQAIGERWVSKHLPRHFIRGAGTRYGYKPRSPKYEKRKRSIAASSPGVVQEGGRVLLVFTGGLRDHLLSGAGVQMRAFPTRASIKLTAPGGIPLRPRRPNFPNIGKELTAVTDEEMEDLSNFGTKAAMRAIKGMKRTKRTTIGG